MTQNLKPVERLTDEELEERIRNLDYSAAIEALKRFKDVKLDLAEMKVQLDRAIKEAVIADKTVEDYKKLNRELIDDYTNQLEKLIEAESRLAYYEGDDE